VLAEGGWQDLPKVLPPADRPGEILEDHAPAILRKQDLYWMIHGPSPMRSALSRDLLTWEPAGVLFAEDEGARDPCILTWDGLYHMVYCTLYEVRLRTSADLREWGQATTILRMAGNVAPESPCLVRHGGAFTLFVCGWDGVWDESDVRGAYQHLTYVYQSDDLRHFDGTQPSPCCTHMPGGLPGRGWPVVHLQRRVAPARGEHRQTRLGLTSR